MRKTEKQRYPAMLTNRDIIKLLRHKVYAIDPDTGTVSQGWGDFKTLRPYVGNKEGHLFIRLYFGGKRKTIAVSRLVWMAVTLCPIPPEFEIHHRDEQPDNNNWRNLLCYHKLDHRKIHDHDVPF